MAFDQAAVSKAILSVGVQTKTPDNGLQTTLTLTATRQLAAQFSTSIKEIELAALAVNVVPLRYQRNFSSLDISAMRCLLQSKAVVIGLGGLGGTVTELLARANVGHLVLVDGDIFEDHNLNRQLLCTMDRLGASKAKAAADRVAAINEAITIEYYDTPMDESNRFEIINGCQVVIDCLDNIPDRFMVQEAARRLQIPMVSGAVAGLAGHVTTIFPEDKGLELIFGSRNNARQSPKGIETILGCLPQTVSLIATLESAEALKILLGQTDQVLRNRLLLVDLTRNSFDTLSLN